MKSKCIDCGRVRKSPPYVNSMDDGQSESLFRVGKILCKKCCEARTLQMEADIADIQVKYPDVFNYFKYLQDEVVHWRGMVEDITNEGNSW